MSTRAPERPSGRQARAHATEQPFRYPLTREYVEPDWRRLPGYRDVTTEQWESAQWQRAHSVKNLAEFKAALGDFLTDDLLEDIDRHQAERATMSMLIPPQMVNTMEEGDLRADRVRRYMAPAWSERDPEWPSHPLAGRERVSLRDTLQYQHIGLHDGSTLLTFLREHVETLGGTLSLRIQMSGFEAICRMVEANVGIGIIPESAAQRHSRTMRLATVQLDEPWAVRERRILARDLNALPGILLALIERLTGRPVTQET